MSVSPSIYTVYITVNLLNQKFYVGVHRVTGQKYLGSGSLLKMDIKKYGPKNFQKYVLYEYDNAYEAYEKEADIVNTDFVERCDTYNLKTGGSKYFRHSVTTKLKISKNTFITEDQKKILSKVHKGKFVSKETRLKMSKSKMGVKFPESRKLSVSRRQCISIIVDGVEYISSKAAAEILEISRSSVCRRLKSKNFPNYVYKAVDNGRFSV